MTSLEDLISDFAEEKYKEKNESWAATCRRSAEAFADWIEENDIDPWDYRFSKRDVESYYRFLDDSLAQSTRKNMAMAMREFLRYAYEIERWDVVFHKGLPDSILEADIAADSTRYEQETGDEIPYIEEHEHEAIIDACDNPRDELIFRTMWDTGCRETEIRNLTVDDVEWEDRKLVVSTAKRDDHRRAVYITPSTKRYLGKWMFQGGRAAYSSCAESSNYLFPTQRSEKIAQGGINRQLKRWADRAGVQKVAYVREDTEHQMPWTDDERESREIDREFVKINSKSYRHSFCVRAVQTPNPISLGLLADLVGHSSPDSLKHYLTFRDEDRKDAFDRYT